MKQVMAWARRDVDQHLVSKVEIFRCFGGVIERQPDEVDQIGQDFK
jgi:hypothetical protein